MTINKTTTDLSTLKINYLTKEMYEDALENDEINENELYITPDGVSTVNNATLTIQKNGTTVNSFTANASSDVTANITVPTKVSDLTNDSGFITGYTETDPIFSASAAAGITSSNISSWNGKQDALVSGTNIKTINNNSILGSGNINIQGGGGGAVIVDPSTATYTDIVNALSEGFAVICDYDDSSVSGNHYFLPLLYNDVSSSEFVFGGIDEDTLSYYTITVDNGDTWSDSSVSLASTDTATVSTNGLMSSSDKTKLDGIASGAEVNVNADWDAVSGDAQILNKPTIPSKTSDLTNDSGFITGMTILSYGGSTWQNFIDAYDANKVVYCRASSNSNPATGSQTRLAFMAYVNNATTPTEVEFQYYRSMSSHTASQQGDQVYVYKLNKTNGWSVTVREASVKVVAGTGLGGTYSNGTMTLTGPTKVSDLTNDSGFLTLSDLPIYDGSVT